MKKIVLITLLLLLTGCVKNDEIIEFEFLDETYEFKEISSDGYDMFVGNGHLIEIKCDDDCMVIFELEEDIYIISGNTETYEITENGSLILIDGTNQNPTGTKVPEWNDDLQNLLELYSK